MSEQTKKISPALQTVIDFSKAVREMSPKTTNKDGKEVNEYWVSKMTMEPRHNDPDKKDAVVNLNNHQGESIKFKLSGNGNMINATYFNSNNKDENGKSQVVFLGKDLNKLADVAQDKNLIAMASQMDWTKVKTQEQEQDTIEM